VQRLSSHEQIKELITKLDVPEEWRQTVTPIIISLMEERKYQRWLMAGLYALISANITLSIKLLLGV